MAGVRVTIMAGGTGGHVFPALAVAEQLRELGCVVSWIGTPRGIENSVVPEAGYSLSIIPVSGLRGKGLKSLLLAPFQLVRALTASLKLLSQIKPNLVLGFGGFVAGPVGLAARLRGDKLAIHEQNARAGTTNKILSRWADRVMTGFPDVFDKAVYVGNPVRKNIQSLSHSSSREIGEKVNILIMGGSQGARSLNKTLPAALKKLSESRPIEVRHQCGPRWFEETADIYRAIEMPVDLVEFIQDMSEAYSWCDLVVCRSGAMTVAEVSASGRPALFIPFPYAIDDHQTANAEWLAKLGGAAVVQESDIDIELLADLLKDLTDSKKLKAMAQASANAGVIDSTDRIVSICQELIDGD